MVFTATRTRELIVITGNETGVGYRVFQALFEKQVNVVAFHGYAMEGNVILTFITEDNGKARKVLQKAGFDVDSRDVILVDCPNKPGIFEQVAGKLDFAGVGIDYAYATSTSKTRGMIVLNTEDNKKALKALA
jgi:hypothetical protein